MPTFKYLEMAWQGMDKAGAYLKLSETGMTQELLFRGELWVGN